MAKKTLNEQLERLETIAALLKDDSLPLEKAVKLYEEGILLSKKCQEELEKAELTVKELSKTGDEKDFTLSDSDT